MLISKKDLFKRKNRNTLYDIYENSVDTLASLAEQFEAKLKTIRNLMSQYKSNSYIYDMLCKVVDEVDSSYYNCSLYVGQVIKSSNYFVDLKAYQQLDNHNARLVRAIGKMESIIDTIIYLENNNLGVRSI